MQDPNPLPWGAQDRFQAHFIVKRQAEKSIDLTARTILETSGHFGTKKVTKVEWQGGKIADTLNSDSVLNELIAQQSVDDATITVDPTSKGVRIYGKWKNSFEFKVSKTQFEIFDKIAGHIKSF
ncbi:hypothetical protein OAJ97_05425 [Candidatus Nitrosopelagicus sp.]|nr:hypothetical protein [Candidatus Nitrosopelagicus sp.]MDC0203126.1 hypothetical protein [Candidatus Nitrosopelagicus sp.]MDC0203548.1 hypothetical protein [Candidatus Nitrosopelagicus sp.]